MSRRIKKGFTLLELIIVIIVIGVLASLALPQYLQVSERSRAAEGVGLLGLLRSAQMRYYSGQGVYANTISDLDTGYTTPKYFTLDLLGGGASWPNSIAVVLRNSIDNPPSNYYLVIDENGAVCCDIGGGCPNIGIPNCS